MFTQTTFLALVALTSAITVTNPNRQTIWDSGKSNTITWTAVSTDPTSFDIYLSHMVGGSPPLNTLLFADVASDKNSVVVEGLQLPTGDAYQINLVAHNKPEQIYAQSNQFNVTGEAVKATSTLEGYTGPTYTPSATQSDDDKKTTSTKSGETTLVTSTTATDSEKSTKTSSETETSTTSDASNTADSAQTSETASGTQTSATPSKTPNAASSNVATGGLAAFVFGAIALFA